MLTGSVAFCGPKRLQFYSETMFIHSRFCRAFQVPKLIKSEEHKQS